MCSLTVYTTQVSARQRDCRGHLDGYADGRYVSVRGQCISISIGIGISISIGISVSISICISI